MQCIFVSQNWNHIVCGYRLLLTSWTHTKQSKTKDTYRFLSHPNSLITQPKHIFLAFFFFLMRTYFVYEWYNQAKLLFSEIFKKFVPYRMLQYFQHSPFDRGARLWMFSMADSILLNLQNYVLLNSLPTTCLRKQVSICNPFWVRCYRSNSR